MNTNLEAALELAQTGWEVFPCDERQGENAKSPMIKNGHLGATRNPEIIGFWWTEKPSCLIGIRVPQALAIIDIDPRNGGSLEALEEVVGKLPKTLTVWSGRNDGGRHLYFIRPEGPLTSSKLKKQAPGIDLKANGYVIAPPSIHPATGKPYRWEMRGVAHMPEGLRELLKYVPRERTLGEKMPTAKGLEGILRKVMTVSPGDRNNLLYWAARVLAEDGYPEAAFNALEKAATEIGLSGYEIERTINSALEAHS